MLKQGVQERFFEFLPVVDATSESVVSVLLDRLNALFPDSDREKLITKLMMEPV